MSDTTPTGRPRAGLDEAGAGLVEQVRGVSTTIAALEAELTRHYRERVDLYEAGNSHGVPKTRMAEAAGCDVTAIIHALRKRERQLAALQPAVAG